MLKKLGSELSLFSYDGFSAAWSPQLLSTEIDFELPAAGDKTPEDLLFAYDVVSKILHRGNLPFPAYAVERHIVELYGSHFEINVPSNDRGSITYEYNPKLRAAYNCFSDLVDDWGGKAEDIQFDPGSPANERRLFEKLIERFGPRLAHLTYTQVPLDTILPRGKEKDFVAQRADFVIAYPTGGGLVVEPGDHDTPAQMQLDAQRDQAFVQSNFETLRPRNAEIDSEQLYDDIAEILERAEVLDYLRGDGTHRSEEQTTAGYLFLLPALLARVEFALAYLLLRHGMLRTASLVIGIKESDLECAELGLLTFISRLSQLVDLYGLEIQIPPIEVRVVGNSEYRLGNMAGVLAELRSYGCTIQRLAAEDDLGRVDILLDVAVKANVTTSSPSSHRAGSAVIRNCYPHNEEHRFSYLSIPRPICTGDKTQEIIESFLRDFFRKHNLRPAQYPVIKNILEQKATVGLLPTSAGKSICYQLAALLTPGTTIVVDPIIALMQDQVQGLVEQHRIDRAVAWHVGAKYAGVAISEGDTGAILSQNIFLFLSPERLLRPGFRDAMQALKASDIFINYAVIDEAHCVSMWGHDFRPSYLSLDRNFREFCAFQGRVPVTVALTGTASQLVLIDLKRELNIQDLDAVVRPATFDRPELSFSIVRCPSRDKGRMLETVTRTIANRLGVSDIARDACGIIFAYRVKDLWGLFGEHVGDARTHVNTLLAGDHTGEIVYGMYTGSSPKDEGFNSKQWDTYKSETLASFKRGQIKMLFGNAAVGVGIDNEQINYIINYAVPQSLEAYYQQCGRAGRNGQSSECFLIFSDDRPEVTQGWLDGKFSKMPARWDDLGTIAYFYGSNFPGADVDKAGALEVLDRVFKCETVASGDVIISQTDDRTEKYVSFWLIIGVIADYAVTGTEKTTKYHLKLHAVVKAFIDNKDKKNTERTERLQAHFLGSLHAYISRYKPVAYAEISGAVCGRSEPRLAERVIGYLIDFVYGQIAYQRREAVRTIVDFCTDKDTSPDVLRGRIRAYFDFSEKFSQKLADMADRKPEWAAVASVIALIDGFDDIEHLYWETRRLLDERFHAGWAAVNLYCILYREQTLSPSALRLLHEFVKNLESSLDGEGSAARTFLIGYFSSIHILDQLFGTDVSSQILVQIFAELYGAYGVMYASIAAELTVPEGIRDEITLELVAVQMQEVIDAGRYPHGP